MITLRHLYLLIMTPHDLVSTDSVKIGPNANTVSCGNKLVTVFAK